MAVSKGDRCAFNPLHPAEVEVRIDGILTKLCRQCNEERLAALPGAADRAKERGRAEEELRLRVERLDRDPLEGAVEVFLRGRSVTTTHEVLMQLKAGITRRNEMRIGRLLRRRFGWVRAQRWTWGEIAEPERRQGFRRDRHGIYQQPPMRYFEPGYYATLTEGAGPYGLQGGER